MISELAPHRMRTTLAGRISVTIAHWLPKILGPRLLKRFRIEPTRVPGCGLKSRPIFRGGISGIQALIWRNPT